MSRQGRIIKQKLKLHPRGRESVEVTFRGLPNVDWSFMGPGHADGSWGEGRLPPLSFPADPPPSVSATEIWKGPNGFAVFFSLCDILKSWKILWNSSVYRAQVKT